METIQQSQIYFNVRICAANEGIISAQREDFLDTNTSEVAISNEHCLLV